MLEISFLAAELILAALWLAVRVWVWIRQKRIVWKREAVLLLLYLDLAIIMRFVFFPRDLVNGHIPPLVFDAGEAFPFRVNPVPLVHLFQFGNVRDMIWNVAGNALLFVPSGIILPVVFKKRDRFGQVLAAGGSISLCIELLQLPFASRASDIDDFLMNILGVAIGYGIYAAVRRIRKK